MIFTGHAELTIDPKQRLAIPAKHRALLNPEKDGNAWYCVPFQKRLMLYTQARFTELAEKGEATLTPREEEAGLEAAFFGLTERLEMDSAGRITIPRLHLDAFRKSTTKMSLLRPAKVGASCGANFAPGFHMKRSNETQFTIRS